VDTLSIRNDCHRSDVVALFAPSKLGINSRIPRELARRLSRLFSALAKKHDGPLRPTGGPELQLGTERFR
jgi:hypothetical protein